MTTRRGWSRRYAAALRRFLGSTGENPPEPAYELGRQAIDLGLGLLDVLDAHQQTVATLLPRAANVEQASRTAERAANFLMQSLAPYEMTQRGFRDAIAELRHEIAARQQAEAELQIQAEGLARELERFAYAASHDLQEPLRTVVSFTQLLARRYGGKLDPEADEIITFAVDGAMHMKALVQNLHEYSRVHKQATAVGAVECDVILSDVLANLRAAIEESGAEVTHASLPVVLGVAGQLKQLFQNLIGNALKFRSGLPPRVHIAAERREGEWLFTVRDNGIGIEPQYAERIFIIFQRLHGADRSGSGIGLAICKRIVEEHGGRIWVVSTPGQGSTFYFTLPVSAEQQAAA